jgi:hypothetical protein
MNFNLTSIDRKIEKIQHELKNLGVLRTAYMEFVSANGNVTVAKVHRKKRRKKKAHTNRARFHAVGEFSELTIVEAIQKVLKRNASPFSIGELATVVFGVPPNSKSKKAKLKRKSISNRLCQNRALFENDDEAKWSLVR